MASQQQLVDRELSGGVQVAEVGFATPTYSQSSNSSSGGALEANQRLAVPSNSTFRALHETVSMTEDWTVCRCQIHRTPNLDNTPLSGEDLMFIGSHPTIKAASMGLSGSCHADPDTRRRDHRFATALLRTLPKWKSRSFNTGILDKEIKNCKSRNKADPNDFGIGYCLMPAVSKNYLWPVARVLGPTALVTDWLKVLSWCGSRTCPPFNVTKREDDVIHVDFHGSLPSARTYQLYNALSKIAGEDPEARVGFRGGVQCCANGCTLACLCSLSLVGAHSQSAVLQGKQDKTTRTEMLSGKKTRSAKPKQLRVLKSVPAPVIHGNRFGCLDPESSLQGACGTLFTPAGRKPGHRVPKPKNVAFCSWVERNIERKKLFLSIKSGSIHFKKMDGKFRPFVKGKPIFSRLPNSLLLIRQEICMRFGDKWENVNITKYLQESAWLNTNRLCPDAGFVMNYHKGAISLLKAEGNGLKICVDGEEIFHLGSSRPSSSVRLEEVVHKWNESKISSVVSHEYAVGQDIIDKLADGSDDTVLTHEILMSRIDRSFKCEIREFDENMIFALACSYKIQYGCPKDRRWDMNFDTVGNKVWVAVTDVEDDSIRGLYFHFDGRKAYHSGPPEKRRSITSKVPLGLQLLDISAGESASEGAKDGDRRSMNSVSTATLRQVKEENQEFINRIKNVGRADDMDETECLRRLKIPPSFEVYKMQPTTLFGIALAFKLRYGCPTKEIFHVYVTRTTNSVSVKKKDSKKEGYTGLFFYLDNDLWYHCGHERKESDSSIGSLSSTTSEIVDNMTKFGDMMDGLMREVYEDAEFATALAKRTTVQRNWWRLIAKAFLVKAQKAKKIVAKQAMDIAKCNIPCTQPWFDKQLIGFRVCARVQGHTIFSRGTDFTRPNDNGPDGTMVTVRQHKRFWACERLVFTPKGLAKVFYRKKNDEKWRFAIARSLGLTLEGAYVFFARFVNEESMPDVVPEQLASKFRKPTEKIVERPVYVEVPVVTKETTPPPPPPPPLPAQKPKERIVNGDDHLTVDGPEGVARRAEFRHHFQTDWWYRVSAEALRSMNRDLINEGHPSRSFDESKLLVDPKQKINLYDFPVKQKPPSVNKMGFVDELKRMGNPIKIKEKEWKDPRSLREEQRNIVLGRVIENPDHETARDSTMADIETNPGPGPIVDKAWPPTFPNKSNRENFATFAWLGDSLLQLNVRLTIFVEEGVINSERYQKLISNEALKKRLMDLYGDKINFSSISTHSLGSKFEYLYAANGKFREYMNNEMKLKSTISVFDDLPGDRLRQGKSHCWRLLFNFPLSKSYDFEEDGFLSTRQLKFMAKYETLAQSRVDMTKQQNEVHLELGSKYSPADILGKLTTHNIVGGSEAPHKRHGRILSLDDELLIQHPQPRELWRINRDRSVSLASDIVRTRRGPVFTEEGSPLDTRFSVVGPSPIDELECQVLHKLPRGPEDADIELNPGPGEDRGRKDNDGKPRERSVSRIRNFYRQAVDEQKEKITDFVKGFGSEDGLMQITQVDAPESTWLKQHFEQHLLVGHLPRNKTWKSQPPLPIWSSAGLMELQNSLDRLHVATGSFVRSSLHSTLSLVNTFFQTSDNEKPISASSISALAHFVKTHFSCPSKGRGYCLNIRPVQKEITFHITNAPDKVADGRLWWAIEGVPVVHGGTRLPRELIWEEAGSILKGKESIRRHENVIHDGLGMDLDRWFVYVYLLLYHWVFDMYNTWVDFGDPKLLDIDTVTPSEEDYPEGVVPENTLLICTFGTYGDQIPVMYYANLAKSLGLNVHVRVFKNMDVGELERLKKGEFLSMLPAYLDLNFVTELGYKQVFVPHIEIPFQKGMSYSLQPTDKWINRVKFRAPGFSIKFWNYPAVEIAERLSEIFRPSWRIGCLSDSSLPRSSDGLTLLSQRRQTGENLVGWVNGSADESVIPSYVKENFPKITAKDHQVEFARYKTIHMHGGAGTLQTAIACGAEPVVHDISLDRDYHRTPGALDFKKPSVGPYLGWLVVSGFRPNLPWHIRYWSCIQFYWSIKFSYSLRILFAAAKAATLVCYLSAHWVSFAIIFFSISTTIWRLLFKNHSLIAIFNLVMKFFWDFPVICLMDQNLWIVACFWICTKTWTRLSQDLISIRKESTQLVYEPVERSGISFPFPFGHWCVLDNTTGQVYEGVFTTPKQGMGEPFKFSVSTREIKRGARRFNAPFNLNVLRREASSSRVGEYGSNFNCVAQLLNHVHNRSVIWTVFLSAVGAFIWLALSPPEVLQRISAFFFPGQDLRDTPFYRSLGFAAGLENIPFELDMVAEEGPSTIGPEKKTSFIQNVDWSDPVSFDALLDELATIQVSVMNSGLKTLDESDLSEVSQRAILHELDKINIPEDELLHYGPVPPYVKGTWAEVVDNLHHAISFLKDSRFVSSLIAWLKTLTHNVYEFILPILEALAYIANIALEQSKAMFHKVFVQGCRVIDHVWGLEPSRRVKTAWGLTGLHRTGMLGVKARLAANIAYSEYIGRTDFESDFNRLVGEGKELAKQYKAIKRSNLGGPQRRPIGYSKPLMTHQEAKLLGFGSDEYLTDDEYQKRVDSYLAQGTTQGADGVFLAEKQPQLIAKSQHRYEPKYPVLTSDDRAFAKEIAQAMFDHYPEVFKDADILPPKAVHNYIKKKYSPGTPFIKPGGFKSRQAMFDAGYDKVMQKRAISKMEGGHYETQFYHAFVKSQVVDVKKCLPYEQGGTNKDVRTVVSQDLFSYYIDQCVQIERNKRINWDTYGAGIGMPLNQSMEKIYSRMADLQKQRGGRYIILDASAFDSICKPFLFEVGGCLWDLGFKDHPSGNGKNISSVVRASYEARQNSWIIGITEKEHNNLCIAVPDKTARKEIENRNFKNIISLSNLIDYTKFNKMSSSEKKSYVAKLELPENKTVLTWDPELRPEKANWMGMYRFGDPNKAAETFFEHQTFLYRPDDLDGLLEDVRRVGISNYRLLSNVHPKNRGGSTGGSDTSNVNTHAFKAGVIAAWCRTTGRRPHEFFEYNDVANTSDDTIWQSGGKYGLNTVNDLETFKYHCAEYGINLEMDTTKDINKVEYLSKFVRTPTAQDSEALKLWRSNKMRAINHSNKQRGLPAAKTIDELNNPRFLVVQNPKAILHRRTAFRYYQSSFGKWKYVSVERGAGHAYNTAFVPELYEQFCLEWCSDVNSLLAQYGINRKYALRNGKFGLQEPAQIDPRAARQSLSPRQKSFLMWLKGNMFPSYYKVIDVHMDIKKIEPDAHARFLRKLERGWRGYEQISREGVDWLFSITDAIPDEWAKKFQPGVEMLYAEQPFYTRNKIVEKFCYLKLLEESTEEEITFGDFSTRIQESPYAGACDPYHFWERMQDKEYKATVLNEEIQKIQGLVFFISAFYMLTSTAEWFVLGTPFFGVLYKLFLWSFIGLNKVYGILNTMYWHSTGKSSREISRIMPRDPYLVSKQFCVFIADFVPDVMGYFMVGPIVLLDLLPPCLEMIGKIWYKGQSIKTVGQPVIQNGNPWSSYAEDYIDELRISPTRAAYVAAKTATGKSSMFVAALWSCRNRKGVRKIWLVEPRRILRDEASIPFGIPIQRLKKGVQISESTDVYTLTYGHLQSRLEDIDPERDIVLFDEFHEEQGEMILSLQTVKARKFLLSATPIDVPFLKGSKYLAPNIDRRFPIMVHKVPDSMAISDIYLEAKNRYPDKMDRVLVIVPTLKMVPKVASALTYLGAGKVTPLTSREKVVPNDGLIVATPYVQTGLDIKPPPKLLIDSGLDVVFDKGRLVRPLPWTTPDIDKQRIGRVGRLEPGVVFQPESAGTGERVVHYPSPNLFVHEVVASHFKLPQLTPIASPVSPLLPFMRVNENKLCDLQTRKSVVFIHALALHGVRQVQWQSFYTRKQERRSLGEDYEWVDRIERHSTWSHVPLLDWQTALYFLNLDNVVQYSIGGKHKWCLPLSAINGKWVEVERTPTEMISYDSITEPEVNGKFVSYQKQIDKFKSHLLREAKIQSQECFERACVMLNK